MPTICAVPTRTQWWQPRALRWHLVMTSSVTDLVASAVRSFDRGEFADAAATYNQALELQPSCVPALVGLCTSLGSCDTCRMGSQSIPFLLPGVTYHSMTPPRVDAANGIVRKLLEIDSESAQARFLLAVGKHKGGDVVRCPPKPRVSLD
jgi:hypothetical protein